jgi:hypothetical protein
VKGDQYAAFILGHRHYFVDCMAAGFFNNPFHGRIDPYFTRYCHHIPDYLAGAESKK